MSILKGSDNVKEKRLGPSTVQSYDEKTAATEISSSVKDIDTHPKVMLSSMISMLWLYFPRVKAWNTFLINGGC